MAKKPGLMDRIDDAVELARREIKKGTRIARKKVHDAQVTVERKTKARSLRHASLRPPACNWTRESPASSGQRRKRKTRYAKP